MEVEGRRYLVTGRVQGVGFRWFVEHEARRIGVKGSVRNLDTGEVEAVALGTADQHAQLRHVLEQGPKAARVDRVTESSTDHDFSRYTGFSIQGAW